MRSLPLCVLLAACVTAGVLRTDPSGFDRRRLEGHGRFVTQAEIASRHAPRFSDLVSGMSGIAVIALPGGGAALAAPVSARVPAFSRANADAGVCLADVYIDGSRVTSRAPDAPFNINDIPVRMIAGIEVYRGDEAPAPFSSPRRCPVVLLWTRTSPPTHQVSLTASPSVAFPSVGGHFFHNSREAPN